MELPEQARALRVAKGLSARQIGERLGVPGRTVAHWLDGLPVPAWTKRPNAKDPLRVRALALRGAGWSVPDIVHELGVSRSTAWLWVRDHPLDRASERSKAAADRRTAAIRDWWAARLAVTDDQRSRSARGRAAGRCARRPGSRAHRGARLVV